MQSKCWILKAGLLGLFLAACFPQPPQAWGTDYTINAWGDFPSSGPNVRDNRVTLREVIMAINTQAPYGDAVAGSNTNVIRFAGSQSPTITLLAELPVSGWVRIEGEKLRPTLRGNGSTRLFSVFAGGELILRDLTLADGVAPVGEGGGAIEVTAGSLFAERVTVRDCYADHGGGISGYDYSEIDLKNSTLIRNFAESFGGGVAATTGTIVEISNTTVTENHANVTGGGVALNHQPIAGDFDFMLQLYCRNATIVHNRVGLGTVISGVGGGIGEAGSWPSTWATTGYKLFNTVVANNLRETATGTAPDDLAARIQFPSEFNLIGAVRTGFNPTITNGMNGNQVGSETAPIAPGLGGLGLYGGTTLCYRPTAASPLLNSGNNDWVDGTLGFVEFDQRNGPRLKNGTVDIGSVER